MQLDDAYANGAHIAGAADFPPRWAALAKSYRDRLSVEGRARLGVMYGHGPREVLDVFLPSGDVVGLAVFVHGGYWKAFDRSSWSHLAEGARAHGYAVAMPSYDLCPRVRITDITRQVAQAITVVAHDIDGPIRLAGHSAGGHQVARMAMPGVLPDDVAARLEHVLPISAVTDLRPLMQTSMNKELRIDADEAQRESPALAPAPAVPVTPWVGADELPAFIEQTQALATAWGVDPVLDPGLHHFDVIDALADPDSALTRRFLGLP